MTVLSVNVNKIAVLRNSRGDDQPDVLAAARCVLEAGAGGITVHPRPDQRHIRPSDVRSLGSLLKAEMYAGGPTRAREFNIEGNVSASPRGTYPGLLYLVRETTPQQVTLVPDGDGQITSDHGFDLAQAHGELRYQIRALRETKTRVSLFVDPGTVDLGRAAELGADRIEIYTGPFAKAFSNGDYGRALADCVATAESARAAGLGVNAGHDLSQANLGALKGAVPFLAEVSIGHALVSEALYEGLDTTVRNYLSILRDS